VAPATAQCLAGFVLFLLVNAVLFIRPSEFVPDIKALELYFYVMVPCLVLSIPVLLQLLDLRRLQAAPATAAVLLFLLAVILSNFVNLNVQEGWDTGVAFLKVTLYYLLFVGLVTTPQRLRIILWWLPIFCAVIGLLTVLQFHKVIELPGTWAVKELDWDPVLQINISRERLMSTGIFADPNEFCLLMTVALVLSLYWLTDRKSGILVFFWLPLIGLFYHAVMLTQSRGGFLAFLTAVAVFFRARFGWMITLILGSLCLPVLLVIVGGRQAGLSLGGNTAQERLGRWSDAFMEFKAAPVFGIGCDQFSKGGELVAHNTYLHAFVELGVFGGVLLVGMFGFTLVRLFQLTTGGRHIEDPELRRMLPFITAALGSYMVGMLTLSLTYVIPTFALLALATVYLNMARSEPALPEARFSARWVLTWAGASVVLLGMLNLFVKVSLSR